ncbi:DUF775-domain-containing protein [Hesseltinella vesiculosa]|uniref:DUF775-domain-containing protein n=1 Tax=Hesseltinella vesiculosa TaxID=101127 RepID=A0A1X2G8R0_9FUNG|nr:DUF775-domain-containing protein [Hesseltinella vesiculosa]
MFGCIAAGRLVQTNLQQVDVNKYVLELAEAQSVNHLVVFLLGNVPFEPGYAATVHLLWQNKDWQLLGGLSNDKPSAIFRISSSKSADGMVQDQTATLGISIEPVASVEQQLDTLKSGLVKATPLQQKVSMTEVGRMASRVIDNLFNYVTSFAVQELPMDAVVLGQVAERSYLPIKVFQTWYDNLSRKLANDPNYLSSDKTA